MHAKTFSAKRSVLQRGQRVFLQEAGLRKTDVQPKTCNVKRSTCPRSRRPVLGTRAWTCVHCKEVSLFSRLKPASSRTRLVQQHERSVSSCKVHMGSETLGNGRHNFARLSWYLQTQKVLHIRGPPSGFRYL